MRGAVEQKYKWSLHNAKPNGNFSTVKSQLPFNTGRYKNLKDFTVIQLDQRASILCTNHLIFFPASNKSLPSLFRFLFNCFPPTLYRCPKEAGYELSGMFSYLVTGRQARCCCQR